MPIATCFSSIANAPVLTTEVQRTLGNQGYISVARAFINGRLSMPNQSILPEVPPQKIVAEAMDILGEAPVPIAASFGNLIELQNRDLRSIISINTADDMSISSKLREIACYNIENEVAKSKIVIASSKLNSICKVGSIYSRNNGWLLLGERASVTLSSNSHNVSNVY